LPDSLSRRIFIVWRAVLFSAGSRTTRVQARLSESHLPARHSCHNSAYNEKVGPTRFFGSFQRGKQTFAVHFYDTSQVRLKSGTLERSSRLDVFALAASKTWKRTQTFALTRQIDARRDRLRLEAQALWLDPNRKTIPMIYLKIMEHQDRESIPVGNRTDIYGVLSSKFNPKAFVSLDGFIPYSHSTVTLSKISYPDAKGQLTILAITSNPGDTSYIAYGWTGAGWKVVGTSTSENAYETALRWNGTQFVPLANEAKTP
jgi:hypothetical protein